MQRKNGFTLVEILFVVIIAAGILMYAVPHYKRAKERAAYENAVGVLTDIGGAIVALERDLDMRNISFTFPVNSNKMQLITPIKEGSTQTLEAYLATPTDAKFLKALFMWKYLDTFPNPHPTGYSFYGVSNGSAICESHCADANVVACMCKTGTTDGCFYGAMYLKDGTIKRIKLDACQN